MIPFYNKNLLGNSKSLRKSQTYGERLFWSRLKNKQFLGLKFRRQYVIDRYIADFYCGEILLVIEIDGSSHDENKYEYDKRREEYLISKGLKVVRFTEFEVRTRIDDVLQTLENLVIETSTSPQPSPARRG